MFSPILWSFGIVSHAWSGSIDFTIIIFLECCCPCLLVWACWLFFLLFSIWASQFHSLSWSLSYSPSATLIWALSSLKVTLLIQILIMNGGELGLRYGHLSVFQCVSTPCVCVSRKCQCVRVRVRMCVCVCKTERIPDWWEVMTGSSALPSSIILSFSVLWLSTLSLKLWKG